LIQLKELVKEEMSRDPMSTRIFDGVNGFQGTPEDYWGMPLELPQWLQDAHNRKSGRCFIFGTGPSLVEQKHLLHHMQQEETWTVNRMRHWEGLPFTPTVHCIAEPGPVMEWGRAINHVYDFPEALNRIAVNWWPVTAPGWLWCPKAPDDIQCRWEGYFGTGDFLPPIPTAWASPLTVGQVALWMGYTEIYLLGCDTSQEGQAWDPVAGRTARERNIRSILECAERAGRDVKRSGRKLMDCTPGGRLNREGALEYIPLEDVLEVTKKEAL
jgi:hypothetical protein